MADLLQILTNVAGLTAAEYGVGPTWDSEGKQLWSDGIEYADVIHINSVNDSRLVEVRKRIYDNMENAVALNYIVTGDSTRVTPEQELLKSVMPEDYYNHMMMKLSPSINIDMNGWGGLKAETWANDTGNATLTECLALISGTGENSIVEFSLGLNDWDDIATYAEVKTEIVGAVNALIAAKADIAVILSNTLKTASSVRNQALYQMYEEIAEELQLPLFDAYAITKTTHGDLDYYQDGTHPNEFGVMRWMHRLFNWIAPSTLKHLITYDDMANPVPTATVIKGKFWNTTTGLETVNALWTSLEPIFLDNSPCTVLVTHSGNREDIMCMDSEGVLVEKILISTTIAPDRPAYIPPGVAEVRINVDNDNTAYDPDLDMIALSIKYMHPDDINKGLLFIKNTDL